LSVIQFFPSASKSGHFVVWLQDASQRW
jgi:hypothetical protein